MSVKNVYDQEAKAKLKELAEDIDFCMMATDFTAPPIHAIPMSTKKVDEKGSIWFLSGADSDHNKNIKKFGNTQLIYAKPTDMEFMTVYGPASVVTDRKVIKELYDKSDDNWFNGPDDPNATAIEVRPQEAHYWDTKDSKLVAMFKMAAGTVTGQKTDPSVQGSINV